MVAIDGELLVVNIGIRCPSCHGEDGLDCGSGVLATLAGRATLEKTVQCALCAEQYKVCVTLDLDLAVVEVTVKNDKGESGLVPVLRKSKRSNDEP